MKSWINILTFLVLMIVGIKAQGLTFPRRLVFLPQRQLALRRAFPFGVPLAFRGGRVLPSTFARRLALAERQRPFDFDFGPSPFPFDDFGARQLGRIPLGTTTAFPPGFFEGRRFGAMTPLEAGSFGMAGDSALFPGRDGFPAGNGFGSGRVPPTGGVFPPSLDGPGSRGEAGSRTPADTTGGMTGSEQGGSSTFPVPDVPRIPSGTDGGMNNAGSGSMFTGTPSRGDGNRPDGMGGPGMRTDGMGGGPGMRTDRFDGPGMRPDGFGGPGMRPDGFGGPGMRTDGFGSPGMRTDGMGGAGQFPRGAGLPGSFSGFGPFFPGQTTFGPGFGRPMPGTGAFPGDRTRGLLDGRIDSRAPNGQLRGGQTGFGREFQGFGRSDRSGLFPQGGTAMTRDPRFAGMGAGTFDSTMTIDGRPAPMTPFSGDPRFASFGQTGRFAGRGPEFSTPGARTDPNFNLRFQSFPGTPGLGGSRGSTSFPMGSDRRTSSFNNNFNGFGNNNMQPLPTGSGAAQIDGFGAVPTNNNNLNNNLNNNMNNNMNNQNNPASSSNSNEAPIIRFDSGATGNRPEVISNTGNAQSAAGSNEFRVVEVGNLLEKPATGTGSGTVSVSSTDQSVVNSMGLQPVGNSNIAAQDLTATTVLTDGNQSSTSTDNLSLRSPLDQDFSFFVPSDNTGAASSPQGATFNAPEPPPPPPIMVANDNNVQPATGPSDQGTKEHVSPFDPNVMDLNEPIKSPDSNTMGTNDPFNSPDSNTMGTNDHFNPPDSNTMETNDPFNSPDSNTMGINDPFNSPDSNTMGTNDPFNSPDSNTMGTNDPFNSPDSNTMGTNDPFQSPDSNMMGVNEASKSSSFSHLGVNEPLKSTDPNMIGVSEPYKGSDITKLATEEILGGHMANGPEFSGQGTGKIFKTLESIGFGTSDPSGGQVFTFPIIGSGHNGHKNHVSIGFDPAAKTQGFAEKKMTTTTKSPMDLDNFLA